MFDICMPFCCPIQSLDQVLTSISSVMCFVKSSDLEHWHTKVVTLYDCMTTMTGSGQIRVSTPKITSMAYHEITTDLQFCLYSLLPYIIAFICPFVAILLNRDYSPFGRTMLVALDLCLGWFWFPFGILFSILTVYHSSRDSFIF